MNRTKSKTVAISLSEILILIVGIFAFVWLVSGIPSVSADDLKGESNLTRVGSIKNPPLNLPQTVSTIGLTKFSDFLFSGGGEEGVKETVAGPFLGISNTIWGIAGSAAAAFGVYSVLRLIEGSPDFQNIIPSLGGALAGVGVALWTGVLGEGALALGISVPVFGAILVVVLFVIFALFSSSVEEAGTVVFYCNQWQPMSGGEFCGLCNNQEVPCSIYQCKSLGKSCAFIDSDPNEGGNPFCFWNNSNDISPPIIEPNPEVLRVGYVYAPDNSISPPDRGVKVVDTREQDGCLSPFSTVTFGVKLNEPAQCKISFDRRGSYEEMSSYMGGMSTLKFNHSQTIKIPEFNHTIGRDNLISAYVRCEDSNGNSQVGNYLFNMCIQEGPDTTPPIIEGTSLANNTLVSFNTTSAPVDFYVNEPAQCKWSFTPGRNYGDMENNMSCATEPEEINMRMSYTCSTELTGIRQTEPTFYYVKCQDVSESKNTNVQDYVYALKSSRALSITSASPNSTTIYDSTTPSRVTLEARTFGGVYDGSALCYYSRTGVEGSYTIFDNTSSVSHSTNVYLTTGSYDYYIRCHDMGGNADTELIQFDVEIDQSPPLIARAYYEDNQLKIITNENAECVYTTFSCIYNFEEGSVISSSDQIHHYMGWNTETPVYLKCQDIYGNQPSSPTACSMVLRPQNYQFG